MSENIPEFRDILFEVRDGVAVITLNHPDRLNVFSGMTGKLLLDRSKRFLAAKRESYLGEGMSEEQIEKRLFWDATTYDLMKKWRSVYLPITLAFVVLGLGHIVSILLFWQWQ